MKKSIKVLGILFISVLMSCEEIQNNEIIEMTEFTHPFKSLDVENLNKIITNESDPEIAAINEVSLELTAELKTSIENNKSMTDLYSLAEKRIYNVVHVSEINNSNLLKKTSNNLSKRAQNLSYRGVNYEANYNFVNYKDANFIKKPIVSSAIELEDTEDCIDCIAAYIYNEAIKDWELIKLSEEDVLNNDWPLIVISQSDLISKRGLINNEFIESDILTSEIKSNDGENASKSMVRNYNLGVFRINTRHEASGRSEVFVQWVNRYYPYSGAAGQGGSQQIKIAEVSKNDIKKDHYRTIRITDDRFTAYGSTSSFGTFGSFNMYERDWYHSVKSFGEISYQNELPLYLGGNARFSTDYFLFDPQYNVPVFASYMVDTYGSHYYYRTNGKIGFK